MSNISIYKIKELTLWYIVLLYKNKSLEQNVLII